MLGIIKATDGEASRRLIFWLYGKADEEKFRSAMAIAHHVGLPLLTADLEEILVEPDHFTGGQKPVPGGGSPIRISFPREGRLPVPRGRTDRVPQKSAVQGDGSDVLGDVFQRRGPFIPEGAEQLRTVGIPLPLDLPLIRGEAEDMVRRALRGVRCPPSDIDNLASRFTFEAGKIRDVLSHARALANGDGLTADDIYSACRARSGQRLGASAKRVTPRYRLRGHCPPRRQNEPAQGDLQPHPAPAHRLFHLGLRRNASPWERVSISCFPDYPAPVKPWPPTSSPTNSISACTR